MLGDNKAIVNWIELNWIKLDLMETDGQCKCKFILYGKAFIVCCDYVNVFLRYDSVDVFWKKFYR